MSKTGKLGDKKWLPISGEWIGITCKEMWCFWGIGNILQLTCDDAYRTLRI